MRTKRRNEGVTKTNNESRSLFIFLYLEASDRHKYDWQRWSFFFMWQPERICINESNPFCFINDNKPTMEFGSVARTLSTALVNSWFWPFITMKVSGFWRGKTALLLFVQIHLRRNQIICISSFVIKLQHCLMMSIVSFNGVSNMN